MLEDLERKLVAVAGDVVADRPHLDVVQMAGPGIDPAAGRGTIRLGVAAVLPEAGFDRDVVEVAGPADAPVSRRVLPLRFTAAASFAVRPTGTTPAERTAARTLLLGDVSAIGHALAASTFIDGRGFAVDGDPGFTVKAFNLAGGDLDPETTGSDPAVLRAALRWDGRAVVWPTTPPQPESIVNAVDIELIPTPLALSALEPVVRQGDSTIVTIDGVAGRRTVDLDPPTAGPLSLAVSVRSDLPPADRGRIDGGAAGSDQGVRIVAVADSGTTITYQAPTAPLGNTRVEFVVVHLATPDGHTGVFLDAIPIRLVSA